MPTRREFLAASAAMAATPESFDPTLRLWDDHAAAEWNSAYPIGNGRFGAMIFGGVGEELSQLNEDTLTSSARGVNDLSLDISPEFDRVVKMLRARQYVEAADLMSQKWCGRSWPCYQPLGDLKLTFGHTAEAGSYRRECFASFPQRGNVVRLTAGQGGQLNFRAALSSVHTTA